MSVGTGPVVVHTVTPVLSTSAYADGDVMAVPIEVPDFFDPFTQSQLLQSVLVLDKADQGVAFDIILMGADGSLGTLNGAAGPSDAVAATITGVVSVVAGDYVDLANSQLAIPQFNPVVLRAANNAGRSLWLGLISRSTGTYAADSIDIRLGVLR